VSFDPLGMFEHGGFPSILRGTVYQAPSDTQHGVRFIVPEHPGTVFGPAPWPFLGAGVLPVAGDEIIAAFPNGLGGDPWVIGVWQHPSV
jgi:hypothetical protein